MQRFFRVLSVVLVIGAGAAITGSFSRAAEETGVEEALKPEEGTRTVFSKADMEKIQQRLDRLTEQHQKLTQAMQEIKDELAVIKVRVTN